MPRLHANNYDTTLDEGIDDNDTSMEVVSAAGLPAVGSGTVCYLTLESGSTREIVEVTAATGTTLTIVRGKESTTPTAFSAGTTVSLRVTASSLDDKEDDISGRTLSTATVATGDKVLIQDVSDSNNLKTVTAQSIADLGSGGGGISDGDKGDITVASSGTVWTIDTPSSATVATDDKVLIKDTSNSDATRYVTAQSIADLGGGGGGSGSMVYISSVTANNTNDDFTFTSGIDSTYDVYVLIGSDIKLGFDGDSLHLRTSTNGGSSYASSGGDYKTCFMSRTSTDNTVAGQSAGNDDKINITHASGTGNASGEAVDFMVYMYKPSSTSNNKYFKITTTGQLTDGEVYFIEGTGVRMSTADIDAITITSANTTNITSGTVRLYGIANS